MLYTVMFFKKTFRLRMSFYSWRGEEGVNGETYKCEMKQSCSRKEQRTSLKAQVPSTALYSRLSDTSF